MDTSETTPHTPTPSAATVRAAGTIASVTLVSRVLGLVRDVACASLFGATYVWDAFVLAFMIPNVFRRLFGEGALAAAFVPVFTATREREGSPAGWQVLRAVASLLALALGVLVVLVWAASALVPAPAVARLLGAADPEGLRQVALVLTLLPLLFPYVVLVCLTAVFGAALNVLGRFALPAAGPVVLNVFWIVAAVWLAPAWASTPEGQIVVVAGAIMVGALFQLALVVVPALAAGASLRPARQARENSGARLVVKRMAPAVLGLGVLQVNVLMDTVIAQALVPGAGAVSALYYGNRLLQFPLALIGVAMGVAVFPVLARHVARGEPEALGRALSDALRRTVFVALPAAVGLIVLARPIIRLVFLHGAFTAEALDRTSFVLMAYGAGLWASCLLQVVTRGYYALGDTKTPVRVAVAMVAINLVLNLVLVLTPLREAGLALSTAITAALNLAILWPRLRRRQAALAEASAREGALVARASVVAVKAGAAVGRTVFKSALAAAVMGLVVLGLGLAWDPVGAGAGRLAEGVFVLARVALGIVAYALCARALGAREVGEWLAVIRHQRRSGEPSGNGA